MKKNILLIALITAPAQSALYTDDEISQFLAQQQNKSSSLTRAVLTSSKPIKVVKNWILSDQSELEKEYQLLALLDHLATMSPDEHLAKVLTHLNDFKSHAVKSHPEGHHPGQATMAVFNVSSKAAGVQNVWHMKSVQQKATDIFTYNKQPIPALEQLLAEKNNSLNPALLGIKNALHDVSTDSVERFKQHLYQAPKLSLAMYAVVADLSTSTTDTLFTTWAISHVNKTQAERIYRLVSQNYSKDIAIDILTKNIASQANPSFVASLLTPFNDHNLVTQFLLEQLNNKSATRGAAYALSKNSDPLVWKTMEQIYNDTQHAEVKNSIKHSFKSNQNKAAHLIYQRLIQKQGAES